MMLEKASELRGATDAQIDSAVRQADPQVLRGLLYQLTGDESLIALPEEMVTLGYSQVMGIVDKDAIRTIREKAAAFLRDYRDGGAKQLSFGSLERLRTSLNLTACHKIPEEEFEMWCEQAAIDPWGRGLAWKEKPSQKSLENFTVAVIGCGMGGLNAQVLLKQAGVPFVAIEKSSGVGGSWHDNRYPGCRLDSPSRTYAHLYGIDFSFSANFSPQTDNQKYYDWMADHFDLRRNINFNTEVKSLRWHEDAGEWEIHAEGPDGPREWRANAIFSSVGFLSRPNMPDIDGAETFEGPLFHTTAWPDNLDLKGKRVAVIGSGASGYQLTPVVAKQAEHVTVFQRQASWVFDVPGYTHPFTDEYLWLERNFPFFNHFMRFRLCWISGPDIQTPTLRIEPGYTGDDFARSPWNKRVLEQRRAFIQKKLGHIPGLPEKMTPKSPPLATRWVLVDDEDSIYDALGQGKASVITDPIDKIVKNGILTKDGVLHPADIIVYATGFKANDFLWPMDIVGRDGARTEKLWEKDGPRAYMGTMLPGFPNFFMIYGPNTNNFGGLQIVDLQEMMTRFGLECIAYLISSGKKAVEVSTAAYWNYNDELDRNEALMIYADPRAVTYYKNASGRSSTNCAIDVRKMWRWLRDPSGARSALYDVEKDPVRPVFGADLEVR